MARAGQEVHENLLSFAVEIGRQNAEPRGVRAGTGKRARQACADHVIGERHDGNGRRGSLRRANRGVAAAQDRVGAGADDLGGDGGKSIVARIEAAAIDRKILSLDESLPGKLLKKWRPDDRRQRNQHADPPHAIALLAAPRARPKQRRRGRRTAQERDELAALHSITLSARTRIESGTVRPSAFAVLRLMTNSNLVGCSTGRSAGLAPLRILST